MGDVKLTSEQKQQLRAENQETRKIAASRQFRTLTQEAEAMPLRAKTQYPIYMEVRMLHLVRGVAKAEGIPVQELIRRAIQSELDRAMTEPPSRKSKPSTRTS